MKSRWEVLYAKWLDSQGKQWLYEPTFILSNGYAYLPDFQLSDGVIIEIKGYMRTDAEVKWRMFEAEYPQVIKHLLRKEDLKRLGILT
jgi:predicted nuclease of restriction endonuclease-like RecB superfamily